MVHACRAVLPGMVERRRGEILVVTCDSGVARKLHFSSYATAKTAIVRFVEAIAQEVADHNVQINSFDPGPTYTSMTDEVIRAGDRLDSKVVAAAVEVRRTGGRFNGTTDETRPVSRLGSFESCHGPAPSTWMTI